MKIERYDFGEEAQNCFGNDVAVIYTVSSVHWEGLIAGLKARYETSAENALVPTVDWSGLHAADIPRKIAAAFPTVGELIWWPQDSTVPFSETFDSWA